MTRTELAEAAAVLREAVGAVDDPTVGDRIGDQADQIEDLAERDRGPDHGRLDRHQQVLRDIKDEPAVGEDTAELLDEAIQRITTYRQDLPGV